MINMESSPRSERNLLVAAIANADNISHIFNAAGPLIYGYTRTLHEVQKSPIGDVISVVHFSSTTACKESERETGNNATRPGPQFKSQPSHSLCISHA